MGYLAKKSLRYLYIQTDFSGKVGIRKYITFSFLQFFEFIILKQSVLIVNHEVKVLKTFFKILQRKLERRLPQAKYFQTSLKAAIFTPYSIPCCLARQLKRDPWKFFGARNDSESQEVLFLASNRVSQVDIVPRIPQFDIKYESIRDYLMIIVGIGIEYTKKMN